MSAPVPPCSGYACPPTHSVPSSTVVVVRTDEPVTHLAGTGGGVDGAVVMFAVIAVVLGALLALGKRAVNR